MEQRSITIDSPEFSDILDDVLSRGKTARFIATGNSMAPFIRTGEPVDLAPHVGRPKFGQIVMTRSANGRLLLHRVVRLQDDKVITQGDACSSADFPVPCSAIIGTVVNLPEGGLNLHLLSPFRMLIPFRTFLVPALRSLGLVPLVRRLAFFTR